MPKMLFAAEWTEKEPKVIFAYPLGRLKIEEISNILRQTLKEILPDKYLSRGFYFFNIPYNVSKGLPRSIIMYYSVEPKVLVGLLLDIGDNPQLYRGILMWIYLEFFAQNKKPSDDEAKIVWQKVIKYPSMSFEQKMIDIFACDIVQIILEELRKNGYMNIYEIMHKILNKMSPSITAGVIRDYLRILEAHSIVEIDFNPISFEEIVYLIYDLAIVFRRPKYLKELLKKYPKIKEHICGIIQDYKEHWENYQVKIAKTLRNPLTFEMLLMLRKSPLRKEKLNDEYLQEVNKLHRLGIIIEKNNIYYLALDPTLLLITPEKTLRDRAEFILSLTSHTRSVETVLISEWLEKILKKEL